MADTKTPGAEQAPAKGGVSPQDVRSKIQVPQQFQQALDRAILAGRKILYSPQMTPQIQQLMQGPDSMGDKLAKGVAGLIGILVDKSNKTLPPQILIPAAVVLVAEAGELVNASDEDVAEGMAGVIEQVLNAAGVTPDKLPGMLEQVRGPQEPDGDEQGGLIEQARGEPAEGTPADAAEDAAEGETPATEEEEDK